MTPKERARDLYMQASIHYDEIKDVAAAIEVAVKEERERCAKVAESFRFQGESREKLIGRLIAKEIRAT